MMKNILTLSLCFLLSIPAFAEEANTGISEELIKQIDEENTTNAEKQPEIEIIHKVEHKVTPLPECNNPILYEKTKEFLKTYFAQFGNLGTLYRRRQYFVINSLDKFINEDISAYKTAEKQAIANAIANVEVNYNLQDDNLRLCKNTSENQYAKDTYLLISPKDDGYVVQILNLMDRQTKDDLDISFFYQDAGLISQE
jgi:hypothetical protein